MEISALFNLQFQMFALMLVGLLARRFNIITEAGTKSLTDVVIYIVLPANIIQSFRIEFNLDIFRAMLSVLLISTAIQILCFVLCRVLYKKQQAEKRKVLQYATTVSNAGFLGNPIAEGVFGSLGLAYASIYLIPQRIVMWSAGISYYTVTDKKTLLKKVCTHPCIIAVLIGVVLMLTNLPLPEVLSNTLASLSNCNTALSMMVIGTILARLDFRTLFEKTAVYYCVLRLMVIPLVVYFACLFLPVDDVARGVCVLLAAMPAATTTAILAAKYNCDELFASKLVTLSTLISLITIPAWSLFLLK